MKFQLATRGRAFEPVLRTLLLTLLLAGLFGGCTPPGPASLLEGRKLLDRGEARAAILPLHDAVQIMRCGPGGSHKVLQDWTSNELATWKKK